MVVRHRDVVLAHMKVLGLRLNAKKSECSPAQRTTNLGVVLDSLPMQARMTPARFESILIAVARVKAGGHSLWSSFRDCWVWWQLRPTWYLLACCTWDPYSGCSRPRGFPWRLGIGSVEWSPSHVAYQSPRDAGHAVCTEVFPPRPERSPCVGAHRQHIGGPLYQPPRRSALVPLYRLVRHILVWAQYGSGRPVETGAEARGMDASPKCGEENLESGWPGSSGPLRYSGDSAMSPLVLSSSSSSEYGSRTWFLSLMALHRRFTSGGISSHRQGTFTPTQSYGSCGCGLWGGAAHNFRSLNRGCWDHTPIQSSLSEETVCPEVETLHFMVQRSPAQSSQLRGWYSAGVPAGSTLHRVDPLHLEGKKKSMWQQYRPTTPLLVDSQLDETPWLHVSSMVRWGLQYGPVCHLESWRWCSRLSVDLPSSLSRRFLIAISL